MEPTQPILLAYVFAAFVVGTASASSAFVLVRVRRDPMARAFLVMYLPLTALVLSALLLVFAEHAERTGVTRIVEYTESFLGRYSAMLGLPLFAHRVFGARTRRRDGVIIGIVLTTFVCQHLTEFVLGDAWDRLGDTAEDVIFAGIVGYTVWLGVCQRLTGEVVHLLVRPLLVLLVLVLPVAAHDLFVVDGPGTRWYPLWYGAFGAAAIVGFLGRRSGLDAVIPSAWGLTPREKDVLALVRLGLGNDAIAERLTVSPNTVKTHLRAIFDKSGIRSRVALIVTLAAHTTTTADRAPPIEARAPTRTERHHPIG